MFFEFLSCNLGSVNPAIIILYEKQMKVRWNIMFSTVLFQIFLSTPFLVVSHCFWPTIVYSHASLWLWNISNIFMSVISLSYPIFLSSNLVLHILYITSLARKSFPSKPQQSAICSGAHTKIKISCFFALYVLALTQNCLL